MARVEVRRDRRKVCVGDLRDRILLQNRKITEPPFGSRDFDENFSQKEEVWALVKTVTGKTFFSGVSGDVAISHEVIIRYDATVTSETWILLEDKSRLDVVTTEDLEKRHEYLRLLCIEKGLDTVEASKA